MRSVRTFALLFHFVSIVPLYWTMVDCVQVTTESADAREESAEKFRILISFSLACLFLEAVTMSRDLHKATFWDCVHVILDCIGAFMSLWIAADGLSWHTYIPVAGTTA